MMLQYNDYYLEINPLTGIPAYLAGETILKGECKEIKFYYVHSSFDRIISIFKDRVNSLLNKREEPMTNLWDAVEHNERIELLLTRLEDDFKELKQKGYLMNFNVKEKLKEIDKHINTLLEEQSKLNNQKEKEMMKVTFTYGDTVKIILNQNDDGFYVYTPKNNITSPIKFFSIKDAILFFSNFLPIKVYDEEENSLSFEVTLEYKDKTISFYMRDEDKTKIAWTDYATENKGFNDFWSKSRRVDDSIDDIIKYFIKWVDTTIQENEEKKNKELENIYTGIYFEYKGSTTRVKLLDFDSGKCFNCLDGTIVDSTILGLYEKFKNAINGR